MADELSQGLIMIRTNTRIVRTKDLDVRGRGMGAEMDSALGVFLELATEFLESRGELSVLNARDLPRQVSRRTRATPTRKGGARGNRET